MILLACYIYEDHKKMSEENFPLSASVFDESGLVSVAYVGICLLAVL